MLSGVSVIHRDYLLIHGSLEPFSPGRTVEDFSVPQILFSQADYNKEIITSP